MQTHPIRLNPVFIKTKNVRNFEVTMDALALGEGEGRLAMIFSQAGRGKTRTSQWYAAHNDCVYLRCATIWRTGESDFLAALCKELQILSPPKRKGPLFAAVVDALTDTPKAVFIDEIEKLPRTFLDLVRDISDMSAAPFILIGEEELVSVMRRNRRVWSRTYQQLEFLPIGAGDIMVFAKEAAGLSLSPQVANLFLGSSKGDFRIVKRDMLSLVQIANARKTEEISEEMATIAIKSGLQGR